MRYAFINNFEQILAQAVSDSDSDTSITLDGGGEQISDASEDLVYVLTLFKVDSNGNETAREILHVTAASGNALTVKRAQEGTAAQAWAVGDGVSQRLTAGGLNQMLASTGQTNNGAGLVALGFESVAAAPGAVSMGEAYGGLIAPQAVADATVAIGPGSIATAPRAMALAGGEAHGQRSFAAAGSVSNAADALSFGVGGQSLGARSLSFFGRASDDDAIALGADTFVNGAGSVGVGVGASTSGERTISAGPYSSAGPMADGNVYGGIALGADADAQTGGVSIGDSSLVEAPFGISLGPAGHCEAPEATAVGYGASVTGSAAYSIALGRAARAGIPGGLQIQAISYLPAAYDDAGSFAGPPPSATRRASQQVVVATDTLDLTDDAAAVTLGLPANSILLINAIDVVIVGSDGAGGSPEITIGPDDVTPAAYLASTPVGKTTMGGRESHTPLVVDGVTSLRVTTSAAGTGTTYQAKVIFRGYVMEL